MIKGIFHLGSGLGNQLHRYVGSKVIALNKGEEHTMIGLDLFKGRDFFYGLPVHGNNIKYEIKHPSGEVVPESYEGVLDGEFQGMQYFEKYLDEVREWLKVEPLDTPDDLCIIGFRGGEYVGVPELFLPKDYWDKAIQIMRDRYPSIRFEVHTDDIPTARRFFPNFQCIHDIGLNWRSVRYAKHLIIANSSFFILPAILNEDAKEVLAPKYWARYNTKEWINPDNATYSKFTYIHHNED